MLYFHKNKISCPPLEKEEIESLINQKTSKNFNSTLSYVIFEERPLAGERNKAGEMFVSRVRHAICIASPRIITHWQISRNEGKPVLETKVRLSFLSTLAFAGIALGLMITIFTTITSPETSWLEDILTFLIFMGLFAALIFYEIRTTERLLIKIMNKESLKHFLTA